jgi:hypothetical protein
VATRGSGVKENQTEASREATGEARQTAGFSVVILPVYPPVNVSLSGYYGAPDMGLEMRIRPDERGLKVPCSATELPAQPGWSLPNLVGESHERQRGPPGLPNARVSLSEEN